MNKLHHSSRSSRSCESVRISHLLDMENPVDAQVAADKVQQAQALLPVNDAPPAAAATPVQGAPQPQEGPQAQGITVEVC